MRYKIEYNQNENYYFIKFTDNQGYHYTIEKFKSIEMAKDYFRRVLEKDDLK